MCLKFEVAYCQVEFSLKQPTTNQQAFHTIGRKLKAHHLVQLYVQYSNPQWYIFHLRWVWWMPIQGRWWRWAWWVPIQGKRWRWGTRQIIHFHSLGEMSSPTTQCMYRYSTSQLLGQCCSSHTHVVWTLDPTRKDLVNNLARKCLAEMPRFLNSANFLFQFFNVIGQVLLHFYVLPYSRFLLLIEIEFWLEVMFIPSSTPMATFQHPRHFRVWGPDYA